MRVRDLHRGPARNDVNGITIRRGAPTDHGGDAEQPSPRDNGA
jgi:hypothetical protein